MELRKEGPMYTFFHLSRLLKREFPRLTEGDLDPRDSIWDDLGFDRHDYNKFTVAVETAFGVSLPHQGIDSLHDVCDYIIEAPNRVLY